MADEAYYPEHEKLRLIADKSQVCGEFLEWITRHGIVLAQWQEVQTVFGTDSELVPSYDDPQDLLARFFRIDRNKLEQEKRAMLAEIRQGRGAPKGDSDADLSPG